MGAYVQVYGLDNVLEWSIQRQLSCWGIYVNGGLFSKCESDDVEHSMQLLKQHLIMLQQSNPSGLYKIKFFELLDNKKCPKINDVTKCDGGQFTFKLIDDEQKQEGLQRVSGYSAYIGAMETRIKKLEEDLKNSEYVEDEPETIGSVVVDLLKKPADLAIVANVLRGLFGFPMQNMAAMTGIPQHSSANVTEEEKLNRLEKAMDSLSSKDPHLLTHLEKLAAVAEKDPDKFNMLTSMLDLQKP